MPTATDAFSLLLQMKRSDGQIIQAKGGKQARCSGNMQKKYGKKQTLGNRNILKHGNKN